MLLRRGGPGRGDNTSPVDGGHSASELRHPHGMSSAARRAAALNEFSGRQAGLLTRRQLRELGADADYIRNQAAAGRWQAWGANVVALHTGPLADEQVAWLAVLDGGDDCVLAGLSALHQLGLTGFVVDRVQTAVPAGAGRPMRHDLFLRRVSRRLTPAAVHPVRLPPQMRATAALLDAPQNNQPPPPRMGPPPGGRP